MSSALHRTIQVASLGILLTASANAQATSLGSNTRAYVAVNQQFIPGCSTAGLLGGPAWTSGNVFIDCAGPQYSGHSYTTFSQYSMSTQTYVSAANKDLNAAPGAQKGLVGLSRAAIQDRLNVSSSGATPDSVRFIFDLATSNDAVRGAGTGSSRTMNFGVAFNTTNTAGLAQNVALASGQYAFTFAYAPALLDTWVPFTATILNFANLGIAVDGDGIISGYNQTDVTATWNDFQFLRTNEAGLGEDITGMVNASFASGNDYAAVTTPEPSSIVLVASGLVGLVGVARRRNRR